MQGLSVDQDNMNCDCSYCMTVIDSTVFLPCSELLHRCIFQLCWSGWKEIEVGLLCNAPKGWGSWWPTRLPFLMSVTLNEEFPVGTEQRWFEDEICRQNKSAFPFFVCSYYQILEKAWWPTPAFFPGESHGQRHLAVCSPEGCTESDTTKATEHTLSNIIVLLCCWSLWRRPWSFFRVVLLYE